MKFDDLKISTKVALPAVILTVVALAITGIAAWQSKVSEAATKVLVEQRAPAELDASRFNRRVATIGYAAYRTIANDAASPEAKAASDEIDMAYKEAKVSLAGIKAADPDEAKRVADFQSPPGPRLFQRPPGRGPGPAERARRGQDGHGRDRSGHRGPEQGRLELHQHPQRRDQGHGGQGRQGGVDRHDDVDRLRPDRLGRRPGLRPVDRPARRSRPR